MIEILGVDRADTLMAHLPTRQFDDLATRRDIEGVSERIDNVEGSLTARLDTLGDEMKNGFAGLNGRIDRIVLTLAAGLFAIVATLIARGL